MKNKWLTIAKIQKIRDNQKKLCQTYKNILTNINSEDLRLAAAQVLENEKSLKLSNTMWDSIRSKTIVKLFEKIDIEKNSFANKRNMTNRLNFVGLNENNQVIVLDSGEENIWKISPTSKNINIPLRSNNTIKSITAYEDKISNLVAMNLTLEILDQISYDLDNLIGKNHIKQYYFCIHSFQINKEELAKKTCIGYLPFIMNYVKIAGF